MAWMRSLQSIVSVILLLSFPTSLVAAQIPPSEELNRDPKQKPVESTDLLAKIERSVSPGMATTITYGDALIEIGPNALSTQTTLSFQELSSTQVAAMNSGMDNITEGPRAAYRFLPHGTQFNADITLKLPYDPALIPAGLSEQDIRTWYFDDQMGVWVPLELVQVDTANQLVVSRTNHFTDFINGTLTVPEQPGVETYSPTSLKDIQVANPAQGVNLIDAPELNNRGDLDLSYPIDLPTGRNGLDPELSIDYNSGGGNGWVGIGWDLSVGSVTIDTRWGVPRYEHDNETETYVVGGRHLAPVAHRNEVAVARVQDRVFTSRIEGGFEQIVRHGMYPDEYWWEITDKAGVKRFYGGDPDAGAPVAASVLTDGNGNIFEWLLREVRDLNGNSIKYSYAEVSDFGVPNGTVLGINRYPSRIEYAVHDNLTDRYVVDFLRDRELPNYTRRKDASIDARGGFKRVTADLLKQIHVKLNDQMIRSYELEYVEGPFEKTLLTAIHQYGETGTLFNTHEFEYFDEARTPNVAGGYDYRGFNASQSWNTHEDNVQVGVFPLGDLSQASALSGATGWMVGGSIYIGFNPYTSTKDYSGGISIGFNHSETNQVLSLVDVNGDNLPDKVFPYGGGWVYRPNQGGPGGGTVFGNTRLAMPGLAGLATESSNTFAFGPEIYWGFSAGVNFTFNWTTNPMYMADVNADGLVDLVNGGSVLFNALNGDEPTFGADSNATPVPISSGAVNPAGLFDEQLLNDLREEAIDQSPLTDMLRRWVAPYAGLIDISGDVQLTGASSDGVRVAIQHNGAELWSADIAAGDASLHTPTGVTSLPVVAGDRIYFRQQSVSEGTGDIVEWNPSIVYQGMDGVLTDVNGLDPYAFGASQDFTLAGRPGILAVMPFDGVVRLDGTFTKSGITTDDAIIEIYRNDTLLSTQTIAWDETGDFAIGGDYDVSGRALRDQPDGETGDTILARVRVDSPIDVTQLSWAPELYYISAPDTNVTVVDENGDYIINLNLPYDTDIYPVTTLTAPATPWTVPEDGEYDITPNVQGSILADLDVAFTVKKQGERLAKQNISISGGASNASTMKVNLTKDDEIYFAYSTTSGNDAWTLSDLTTTVKKGAPIDETIATPLYAFEPKATDSSDLSSMLFPQAYRGWSYVAYNGNRGYAAIAIDESRLTIETSQITVPPPPDPQDGDRTTDETQEGFDTSAAGAWPLYADPVAASWRGTDDGSYILASSAKSSRLGREELPVVPSLSELAAGRAVVRTSMDTGQAFSAGISYVGGSFALGQHHGELDYFDMNGDSFPDIVGNGAIQYTTMTGGLETSNRTLANLNPDVRYTDSYGFSGGIGASPTVFSSSGKGKTDTDGTSSKKSSGKGELKVTLGGSIGYGWSDPKYDIIDMNGDGLPDLVRLDGGLKVRLNLGYGFASAEEFWEYATINEGDNVNFVLQAGGGFNKGIFDWAGGVSFDRGDSRTKRTLADINGDGLPDLVSTDGIDLFIRQNTGTGFASTVIKWPTDIRSYFAIPDPDPSKLQALVATSKTTTLGAGGFFTIGIGPLCIAACYLILNPGIQGNASGTRQEVALIDINGDGFVDHLESVDDSGLTVAMNPIDRTNLLREVRRPLGGTMNFDYERKGNTYDQPTSQWVLSRVELDDGQPGDGEDVQLTTVRYEGGLEDRLERDFYGYGRVIEEQRDPGNGEALYRQIVREYRTDSFYTQGLLTRMSVEDAAGNKWVETENQWVLRQMAPTVIEPVLPSDIVATASTASSETSVFPMLVRTDERFYMGAAVPQKSTFTTLLYDDLGNVIEFFDAVDVGSADDQHVSIDYADNCAGNYVVGAPNRIEVRDTNGVLLRKREANVDCATGKMTQLRQFTSEFDHVDTDITYDAYGNVASVTGPANYKGERYAVDYQYDPTLHTFLTYAHDSYDLVSTATYDLEQGKVASTTDDNGNVMTYAYDEFGRGVSVTGPYEQSSGQATISFSYFPDATPPYAVTEHLDPFRDIADPITTVLFMDGLGRVVQTKKDGTVHTAVGVAPEDVMIVSGAAFFDFLGRTSTLYFPITEPLGTPGVYNGAVDSVNPASFTYDLIDRTTHITLPSGFVQETEFGFGNDRDGILRFETIVHDGNGNLTHVYRDVTDLVTAVKEYLGAQEVWTSHGYNAMAELTSVTDDLGNVVSTTYDMLGRRTGILHPDTGLTEVVYDGASNVIAEINENLRAAGQQITLQYDYTSLNSVLFPQNPGNNITYFYGDVGASFNRAGRISMITDQAGSVEYFYGLLGEVTKEVRTFDSDTQGNGQAEVYTTQYTYDSWGRLQELVYPDGELVDYDYDSGGLVAAANGHKGGWNYEYLRKMEYDKFSQPAYMVHGNGVQTTYEYDPLRRRLTDVVAGVDLANPFQNVSIAYDGVGNILQTINDVPVPTANDFGGPVEQNFEYDTLYRMTHSNGEHRFAPNKRRTYSVDMSYDTVNNILSKSQLDQVINGNGNKGLVQKGTTYDWTYQYAKAHTPSQIGDRAFLYDLNGNQAGWDNLNNGTRRSVIWDENNNVQSIFDNGHEKTFKYDHTGQRVMKRGPQGETVYVNQYYTMRNREVGTKHFFVGGQRIAAKLLKKTTGGGGRLPYEKDSYFYHPDHVGSSRYITDADGDVYEHLQYFPFGEVWIEESTNKQRTPYLFAGHEFDEETGLSYFGDRFYEPRTSLWISADPAMTEYLDGFHNGGVYNPRNLGIYSFAFQNPMKYTDLDGRVVDSAWDAFEIGLGIADAIDNAQQGSFFSAALSASGVSVDAVTTGPSAGSESPTPKGLKEEAKKRDQRVAGALLAEAAAKVKAANPQDKNGGSANGADTASERDSSAGGNPLRQARRDNNPFAFVDTNRDPGASGGNPLRQASSNNPLNEQGPRADIRRIEKGGMATARAAFSALVGRSTVLSEFETAGGARATINGRTYALHPAGVGGFDVPTIEITVEDGTRHLIEYEP